MSSFSSWLLLKSICLVFVSLQVLVFENLFVFGTVSEEVTELLLRLIGDAQMEVGW